MSPVLVRGSGLVLSRVACDARAWCFAVRASQATRLTGQRLFRQQFMDRRLDLAHEEGAALNLVEAPGVHQELVAEEEAQLAVIQLRHQDLLVALEHLA